MTDLEFKAWRLHPHGCRFVPAERTLNGTADKSAVRWCGPFTNANKAGWWVFPPIDIDIAWKGGREFEWEALSPYTNADELLIRFLVDESDDTDVDRWLLPGGRSKFSWGFVDEGVVQIWSGCIFQTPPGWNLYLKSPVNFPPRACHVMEAVLESDWLQYDIWLNVQFDRPNEVVQLRRDEWPPLAQLIPVPRDTYDARWTLAEEMVNRNSPEANRVFEYYMDYNQKKFASGGKNLLSTEDPSLGLKDSSTYYKERKRLVGGRAPADSPEKAKS
jgi:hypothetical protein